MKNRQGECLGKISHLYRVWKVYKHRFSEDTELAIGRTSLVLSECEQQGLITRDQKEDIFLGLREARLRNAYAVFELVTLMKRRGNKRYNQFRKILEKRSVGSLADKNLSQNW